MRNTLILLGQVHHNLKEGLAPFDAVVEATVQRARPVILTALAAILAFVPLTHSVFWGTLAYTLIGGTFAGTVLTLASFRRCTRSGFASRRDPAADTRLETSLAMERGPHRDVSSNDEDAARRELGIHERNSMKLTGRTILVTGGSAGIGPGFCPQVSRARQRGHRDGASPVGSR